MYLLLLVVLEISILPPPSLAGLEISGGGGGLKKLKESCILKLEFPRGIKRKSLT